MVASLLSRGAKIDAATNKGNTALHVAALSGKVGCICYITVVVKSPNNEEVFSMDLRFERLYYFMICSVLYLFVLDRCC